MVNRDLREIGEAGEFIIKELLKAKGWTILDPNYQYTKDFDFKAVHDYHPPMYVQVKSTIKKDCNDFFFELPYKSHITLLETAEKIERIPEKDDTKYVIVFANIRLNQYKYTEFKKYQHFENQKETNSHASFAFHWTKNNHYLKEFDLTGMRSVINAIYHFRNKFMNGTHKNYEINFGEDEDFLL